MSKWKHRFVQFARFNGNTPEEQQELRIQAGSNKEFVAWNAARIADCIQEHPDWFTPYKTFIDEDRYNAWLTEWVDRNMPSKS